MPKKKETDHEIKTLNLREKMKLERHRQLVDDWCEKKITEQYFDEQMAKLHKKK